MTDEQTPGAHEIGARIQIAAPIDWEQDIRDAFAVELQRTPGAGGEVIGLEPDDDALFEPVSALLWVGELIASGVVSAVASDLITRVLERVFRRRAQGSAEPASVRIMLADGTVIDARASNPTEVADLVTAVRAALRDEG